MSAPGDSSPAPPSSEVPAEPEPRRRLSIEIVREDGDWSAFGVVEDAVGAAADALARNLTLAAAGEASVVLASDAVVRRLNAAYRGKDAATNVLSFPFQPPPGDAHDGGYLGDVVLAAETVVREAADLRIPLRHHLQHLVVHGLLHLLGHDHASDPEAVAMERLETEILASIGIADPYAVPATP